MTPQTPLYFAANPQSPHVRHWLEITGTMPVTVFHIPSHTSALPPHPNASCITPLPTPLTVLPASLQYILLGLWLRFGAEKIALHAHNTSGYGLAALLSGKNFGVTTYGSEIFSMRARSRFYRHVIWKILQKAKFITASSQHMHETLETIIGKNPKIASFSLGVSPLFLTPMRIAKASAPLWICNRRIHPLYRTAELVAAFAAFKAAGGYGRLILLEGDGDAHYFESVAAQAARCSDIEIIQGFITQSEIISRLDESHFCISAPDTDQLSSSILEGAARGAIPVLRPLESYASVFPVAYVMQDTGDLVADFQVMFEETSAMPAKTRSALAHNARQLIESDFSIEAARKTYFSLLGSPPPS